LNHWIEISEPRLARNFHRIQAAAGAGTTVLAVIKANAYGHGAETCAPMLVRAGATWLGVTCASEGERVRRTLAEAGLKAEILIMSGFLPEDAPQIREFSLTPVLWTPEQVSWLAAIPGTRVHVEVDTGMGRQGVTAGAALDELLQALDASGLIADGFLTHFSSSEVAHSPVTARQQECFTAVVEQVAAARRRPTWVHAGNSSAIDNPAPANSAPDAAWICRLAAILGARPMVRTGIALYGYTLAIEGEASPRLHPQLEPVMTWKAQVLATRTLAPGDTVGYNSTFTANQRMQVALLPVGYADGLRRELSSTNGNPRGWVMLHGRRAPILGRISMNLTVVDVTNIPGVQAGDEAIVLGDGMTADDHARLAGTIAYEILCGIHPCG
jgi:alanine racemase